MAFSPYSTPVQYEYKPLNLSAFMLPLAKMQEQFDTTEAAVKGSEVTIANLPFGTDPKKAKELIQIYNTKRDELAKNLIETKNYKQAAIKLKELNTAWLKDPEKAGLESNYKQWQERDKAERDRIDKPGGITRDEYLQWKRHEINKYESQGGAAFKADYENPTGTYNVITGDVGRLANLDKEREELAIKLAAAIPEGKWDTFTAAGIDLTTENKKFLQSNYSGRTPEEIANKVSAYLKTVPRFRAQADEAIYYNYNDLKADPKAYKEKAEDLNNLYLNSVNAAIADKNKAAEKDKSILKSDQYKQLLDKKKEAEEAKMTGKYDEGLTKTLFGQQHLAEMYDQTALGNLLGKVNVTHEHTFVKIPRPPAESSSDAAEREKLSKSILLPTEDMKVNTASLQSTIWNSRQGLSPLVGDIRKIGGWTVGKVILGQGKNKTEIASNPAAQYDRAVTLRNAIATSNGNIHQLRTKLAKEGMYVSMAEGNKLLKDLGTAGSAGMQELNSAIEKGANLHTNYTAAKENMNQVRKVALEDPEVNIAFNEIGSTTPSYNFRRESEASRGKGGFITGITDTAFLSNYTTPKNKEIIKKYNIKANSDGILSFDAIAKLNGFKNFTEAAMKNPGLFKGLTVDTNEVGRELDAKGMASTNYHNYFGGNIKSVTDITNSALATVGKKGLKANQMTFELINNAESEKTLSYHLSTIDKVINYKGKQSFRGLPGFDENGNPEPGTVIAYDTYKKPRVILNGGVPYIQVPYKFKGGEGTTTIIPRPGTQDFIYSELKKVANATAGSNDPVKKQTNAEVNNALFTQAYDPSSNITQVRADSPNFKLDSKHKEATLGAITIADPMGNPMQVEIVKRLPEGGGAKPYYAIKFPAVGKQNALYKGNYEDVNSLRSSIMGSY